MCEYTSWVESISCAIIRHEVKVSHMMCDYMGWKYLMCHYTAWVRDTKVILMSKRMSFEKISDTGESDTVQITKDVLIGVPLHCINLSSDMMSGSDMVTKIGTHMVVGAKANGVWGQMRTKVKGKIQERSAADEVVVTTEAIVVTTDGAVVHEITKHVVTFVAGEMMFVKTEDLAETSVTITEDLDVTLKIIICYKPIWWLPRNAWGTTWRRKTSRGRVVAGGRHGGQG